MTLLFQQFKLFEGESIYKMHLISPAEINYRKKIEEKLIEDEFLFRITVVKVRQVSELGIELCNIEDEDEESAKGIYLIYDVISEFYDIIMKYLIYFWTS